MQLSPAFYGFLLLSGNFEWKDSGITHTIISIDLVAHLHFEDNKGTTAVGSRSNTKTHLGPNEVAYNNLDYVYIHNSGTIKR